MKLDDFFPIVKMKDLNYGDIIYSRCWDWDIIKACKFVKIERASGNIKRISDGKIFDCLLNSEVVKDAIESKQNKI